MVPCPGGYGLCAGVGSKKQQTQKGRDFSRPFYQSSELRLLCGFGLLIVCPVADRNLELGDHLERLSNLLQVANEVPRPDLVLGGHPTSR
jgi:hypothetical protein